MRNPVPWATLAMALAAPAEGVADDAGRLALKGVYTLDLMSNLGGGLRRGGGALDKLELAVEAAPSARWSMLASAQYVGGLALSEERVGDIQTLDNIDAEEAVRLYEAWAAYEHPGGAFGLRVGLIDLNRDFDVQSVGALFLNSSHGVGADFSQTGRNGPSIFPTTGLAATGYWRPAEAWRVKLGVFDGAPGDPDHPRRLSLELAAADGALAVIEVERVFPAAAVRVGAWSYTARFDTVDGGVAAAGANRGGYALVEGALAGRDDLRAWARIGFANGHINPIDLYLGGGVVRENALAQGDALGLAVAHARFSGDQRRAAGLLEAETAIELTYRVEVRPGLALQPNLQYVVHPGGEPALDDALVGGLRLTAALGSG